MIIFGYDIIKNGKPITNAFQFKGNISPPNLGWAGYELKSKIKDKDLLSNKNDRKINHVTHYNALKNFFDIEIKKVNKIKEKYYYVIDVFDYNFWKNENSKTPDYISERALNDIRSGKAKILVLFIQESARLEKSYLDIFNSWGKQYNLPEKSIVFVSGNYNFEQFVENEKYITHIAFSSWEHEYRHRYKPKLEHLFTHTILHKKNREKIYLNYNRRIKYHRCKAVHLLQQKNLFDYGFVSLGNDVQFNELQFPSIPKEFFDQLPLTFDNTDLSINHAVELVKEDFLNSFISIVSETVTTPNEIFPSEKIWKAIVGMHPFFIISSPGFLKFLKECGYKTFSKWFDESYDEEYDLNSRINMIINEIEILTKMSQVELQNMLIEMLPTLKHNLDNYLYRSKLKTFQYTLEKELNNDHKKLIFGYDNIINDQPIQNCFGNKTPIYTNINWTKKENKKSKKEFILKDKTIKCHYDKLKNYFDIDLKKVSEIKKKYYYILDVHNNYFWKNEKTDNLSKISKKVFDDIRVGKAKLLILLVTESIPKYDKIYYKIHTWIRNYNLPKNSIVLSVGNYIDSNFFQNDEYITYIPYSIYEHEFNKFYNEDMKNEFINAIANRIKREKYYLCYNRQNRGHRIELVYSLKEKNLIKYGFVSLGSNIRFNQSNHPDIPDSFYKDLPITFDNINLSKGHTYELVKDDFLNSYFNILTETHIFNNHFSPTEKTWKVIIGMHPFFIVASPHFLKNLKDLGYKTFSKWFDESYDNDPHIDFRIKKIVDEVERLTKLSHKELQDMLVDMLPTLKHNLKVYLKRSRSKKYQYKLEEELWK